MSTRRPYRVHVHDIGPNFSFATRARADEFARRLVSGETWDGGARGLLGSYGRVTVAQHDAYDGDVLLRRWHYTAETVAGVPARAEVIRRGGSGWVPEFPTCAGCGAPIEPCPYDDHGPASLCGGWRHSTDLDDCRPLVCRDDHGGADGETYSIARPVTS
jgi:hypothetical protein